MVAGCDAIFFCESGGSVDKSSDSGKGEGGSSSSGLFDIVLISHVLTLELFDIVLIPHVLTLDCSRLDGAIAACMVWPNFLSLAKVIG